MSDYVSVVQEFLGPGACFGSQLVLAFDGGWGAGIHATLMIARKLGEEIEKLEGQLDNSQPASGYTAYPHHLGSYFDLCVGSDTGAAAAVMFGRLQMTTHSSINEIEHLGRAIPTYSRLIMLHSTQKLEVWARRLLQSNYPGLQAMRPEDCMMMPPDGVLGGRCQTAVLTQRRQVPTNTSTVDAAYMIRTYDTRVDQVKRQIPPIPGQSPNENMPIQRTLEAALAVPGYFKQVSMNDGMYGGVGPGDNNPVFRAFDEAAGLYNIKAGLNRQRSDDNRVGLVVSIGSGVPSANEEHKKMGAQLRSNIPYFRFDVPGLTNSRNDWSQRSVERIKRTTRFYLERDDIKSQMASLATWLVVYRRGRHGRTPEELFPLRVPELGGTSVHHISNPTGPSTYSSTRPHTDNTFTYAHFDDSRQGQIGQWSQIHGNPPSVAQAPIELPARSATIAQQLRSVGELQYLE